MPPFLYTDGKERKNGTKKQRKEERKEDGRTEERKKERKKVVSLDGGKWWLLIGLSGWLYLTDVALKSGHHYTI